MDLGTGTARGIYMGKGDCAIFKNELEASLMSSIGKDYESPKKKTGWQGVPSGHCGWMKSTFRSWEKLGQELFLQ